MNKDKLFFGFGNSKLDNSIATFSLPAGHSCPMAKICLAKADRITGKITEGDDCEFRCYAASDESLYRNVRASRWNNFTLLQKAHSYKKMFELIQKSLPIANGYVRIHPSGDFFNERYFLAWLNVAINNPSIIFYGYTKMLHFIVKYKDYIPSNFRFIASKGGKCDALIAKHKLKYVEVVYSVNEAKEKNLEIDHDDTHAMYGKKSFSILVHGKQTSGSKAALAVNLLRKVGLGKYNADTKAKYITNNHNFIPKINPFALV